jgi:hypothetical protein
MAALIILDEAVRRNLRRQRVFRDRGNPLEIFDDVDLIQRYRLPRQEILQLVDICRVDIEHPTKRSCAIPAYLQV